jgi:hypothetical protein
LSILGAALGVTLGRSAIAEINPAYFNEPEESFHADLSPYRSPDWAQVQAIEYQAQQPVVIGDLGSGCIGCRDYPVEYYPQHDPAVDGYEDGYAASAQPPAQVIIVATPAADPARMEQVQRYASYQVSSDEKPVQTAATPAEAPAEPTGL